MHLFFVTLTGFLICLIPPIAALAPRAMAFIPAIIGLISYIGFSVDRKHALSISRPYAAITASIVTLMALSTLWGYDADAITLQRSFKIAPIFLGNILLFSVLRYKSAEITPIITRWLPVGCIIAAAMTISNLYMDDIVYTTITGREPSSLGTAYLNRGIVVLSYSSVIAAALLFYDITQRSFQPFHGIMLTFIGVGLLGVALETESQTMHVALILIPLGFILPFVKQSKGWIVFSALVSSALFTAPFIAKTLFSNLAEKFALPDNWDQLSGAERATEQSWFQQSFAANRMDIWNAISERALERPWIGHGVEATRSITDLGFAGIYHKDPMVLHPHNFALQFWIEFGLLGAIIASAIAAIILRSIWQIDTIITRKLCFGLFISALAVCAVSYGLWQSWWMGFWGLMIALAILLPARLQDIK